jgi:hypothetical protein
MVLINSSKDKILNKISDLRTWKSWNEFVNSPVAKNSLLRKPDSAWADYLRVGGNEYRFRVSTMIMFTRSGGEVTECSRDSL